MSQSAKTNGKELKAFYADISMWPDPPGECVWHADLIFILNGVECNGDTDIHDLADDDEITITSGWVQNEPSMVDCDFVDYLDQWRKKQGNVTFSVSAPLDKIEAVKAAIILAGGNVS